MTDSHSTTTLSSASIDPDEVAYFERLAHRWWDAEGPFWPLHRLNGFRLGYVRDHLIQTFGLDATAAAPLQGLRVLDIGCGGGILSESVARLGAVVTGIDITEKNLRVARLHAQGSGLDIHYRLATPDHLVGEGSQFDAVLNMEVVEHVEDLPRFLADCGRLVRPGGVMIVSTINRTLAAFVLAIIGAEYVLRWLPRGTHRFRKLVKPREVLKAVGEDYRLAHRTGVRVSPFTREMSFTRWMGVNYMMVLRKQGAAD